MRQWMYRLSLSLMVVVAFWTSRLPAQEVFVVPATPYAPAYHPRSAPAFYQPGQPTQAKHGIGRCLQAIGIGCAVDPFYPNCGNALYELGFVFGSCRYWMGESCPAIQHGHGKRGDVSGLGCWMGYCNR